MSAPELKVGQTLVYESRDRRYGPVYETKVTKIGRKWVTLDNGHRINPATLWADGGQYSSPGRCWLSHKDREAYLARAEAWRRLSVYVHGHLSPPENVTADNIELAGTMIGIDWGEEG